MKKLISCLLAVALVFSLMGVSVFAAERVVGGSAGTIDDGWSFEQATGSNSQNITINFNGQTDGDGDGEGGGGNNGENSTIVNRYAIDITYNTLVIDLTDISSQVVTDDGNGATLVPNVEVKYVWNVNTHKYDAQYYEDGATEPMDDQDVEDADLVASTDPVVIENAFYITNHSDLSIWYIPTLTPNAKAVAMSMYIDAAGDDNNSEKEFEVGKAIAGVGDANGTATDGNKHTIGAAPASNWEDTINALSAAAAMNGDIIGSITISVSPEATIPTP